jgi:fructoselysine-6-P-deglycase FrlB-like protein
VTLVPTRHPVVDIVPFQRLTVDLADHRGVDPDRIRRNDPKYAKAAERAPGSVPTPEP